MNFPKFLLITLLLLVAAEDALARESREVKNQKSQALRSLLLEISLQSSGRKPPLSEEQWSAQLVPLESTLKNEEGADLLKSLLQAKGSPTKYRSLQKWILSRFRLEVRPARTPIFADGERVFQVHCKTCHGDSGRGDGPLAKRLGRSLRPFSAALNDYDPFNVYNLIMEGMPGMPAFRDLLTPNEIWSLSFYLYALPFKNRTSSPIKLGKTSPVSLYGLAHSTNSELQGWAPKKGLIPWQSLRSDAPFSSQLPRGPLKGEH